MSLARKPTYALCASSPSLISSIYTVVCVRNTQVAARCSCVKALSNSLHRWRTRKCGVEHPLACFICAEHDCSFTVYPPGWLPFGRRPVVHVTASGFDVGGLEEGVEAWNETAFGAAVDAGAKRLWPVTAGGSKEWEERYSREPYGVRRTQARHVKGVLVLMALSAELAFERPTGSGGAWFRSFADRRLCREATRRTAARGLWRKGGGAPQRCRSTAPAYAFRLRPARCGSSVLGPPIQTH